MRQSERLGEVLARLGASGSVSVGELADAFAVSPATVRRDLDLLVRQHLVKRSHGGAIAHAGLYELPLRYKSVQHQDAKLRIAAHAARAISTGMAVGLTGGTTTTEVSRLLAGGGPLTIVTNALNIAAELAVRPEVKLIVTGGTCRSESYELVGPLADATLADLNLDVCFVGVDGLTADRGLTTHHEVEAHTNRVMVGRARRAVVVTDGSKIGRNAFSRICRLDEIDQVVTDGTAPAAEVDAMRRLGVTVSVLDATTEPSPDGRSS